ncbi:MAG: hypothetical protein D6769_03760 [Methanobacteriota archaeon]|nr:MAG: hypothetical protein D6769_03760 [Euryarchaeota archaeon]
MKKVVLSLALFIIVAFIATSLVVLISSKASPDSGVSKASLENAVLEDARTRFADADIVEINNIEEKGGNKYIVVRVTYNYSSTCPIRKHVYYTYPEGLFLPEYPVNVITSCSFCKSGDCLIAYDEEAILASVNAKGTAQVRDFAELNNATPLVSKLGNIWKVKWVADNSVMEVALTQKGSLVDVKLINTTE